MNLDRAILIVAITPALLTYAVVSVLQVMGADLAPYMAPEAVAWEATKWVAGAEYTAVGAVLMLVGVWNELRERLT